MLPQTLSLSAASPSLKTSLPVSCDEQDAIFSRPFGLLRSGIEERAFPAASLSVVRADKLVALKSFGHFTYDPNSTPAIPDAIFDLASVSKVVATTTMAMLLYERGLLDLEAPVAAIVPQFAGSDIRRHHVTVHMLLAHSSGLPGYEKLFLRASTKNDLLSLALHTDLTYEPGTRAEYSDIGFIILGMLLEHIADEPLDSFCQREIFGPLGMTQTMFNPPAALRELIPPAADDRGFRHRVIQGEVQDENASVLGGVAGHAGVFSSATNLAAFAKTMLHAGAPLLRSETLTLFTRRERLPEGTSRALGWDTPSSPSQSGKYLSPTSFGHLGYTGTSLWIDPERALAIMLLTNRTWPDCSNEKIKQIRPQLHDAVVEALNLEAHR